MVDQVLDTTMATGADARTRLDVELDHDSWDDSVAELMAVCWPSSTGRRPTVARAERSTSTVLDTKTVNEADARTQLDVALDHDSWDDSSVAELMAVCWPSSTGRRPTVARAERC